MKNIYLLPTQNNKSKLAIYHYEGSKNIKVGEIGLQVNNNIGWTNCWSERELYITSEEEIKEGDWVLVGYVLRHPDTKNRFNGDTSPIKKLVKKGDLLEFTDGTNRYGSTCKKIILTTDPDLIKDKVLAIPEEFLEWFVQNPSCEEAKVETYFKKTEVETNATGHKEMDVVGKAYKLSIPKKESIHTSYTDKVWEPSKQETVEEAAEKYWSRQPYNEDPFVEGVKWQQERSYSKEEVWKLVNKLNQTLNIGSDLTLEQWFEQFKKK